MGHRPAEVPWSLGRAAEWRQDTDAGGWQGRVVYAVVEGAATVLVEAWVHAAHLQLAVSTRSGPTMTGPDQTDRASWPVVSRPR